MLCDEYELGHIILCLVALDNVAVKNSESLYNDFFNQKTYG